MNTRELNAFNNEREKLLTPDNSEYMSDVIVYLRMKNVKESKVEEMRRDIFDMLIEGQERGESGKQVLGSNYQEFCDALLQATTYKTTQERALEHVYIILHTLLVVLFFDGVTSRVFTDVIQRLITEGDFMVAWDITVRTLLMGIVIYALALLIVQEIGRVKQKHRTWVLILLVIIFVIVMTLVYYFLSDFFNTVIISLPFIVVVIIGVVLWGMKKVVNRHLEL